MKRLLTLSLTFPINKSKRRFEGGTLSISTCIGLYAPWLCLKRSLKQKEWAYEQDLFPYSITGMSHRKEERISVPMLSLSEQVYSSLARNKARKEGRCRSLLPSFLFSVNELSQFRSSLCHELPMSAFQFVFVKVKLKVKVRKEEVVNYVQTERGSFLLSPQLQKRCYQMEFQGKLKTSVESKIDSLTVLNRLTFYSEQRFDLFSSNLIYRSHFLPILIW